MSTTLTAALVSDPHDIEDQGVPAMRQVGETFVIETHNDYLEAIEFVGQIREWNAQRPQIADYKDDLEGELAYQRSLHVWESKRPYSEEMFEFVDVVLEVTL